MPPSWRQASRLIVGDWWGPKAADHQGQARLVLAIAAAAVMALGVADYVTGPILSLTLFYLVPVAAGTIVSGRRAGIWLAAESALASTISDFAARETDHAVFVINGVLLLIVLILMVLLVGSARDATVDASDSARRRREFLAYAAHQLRTPLAGIRASTDALLVGGATASQEQLLANLSREADRAGRLLSSLLQMARVDQGDVGTVQPIDVVDLCQSELDRPRGRSAVTTKLVIQGSRPGRVMLSADATRNALANLLDNARRHARRLVTIEVHATPATVEIAVIDDGPGLPDGTVNRAFERFVSLDGEGGSGLGLPIARGLIEAQGGRLTYEDYRFVIRLPNRQAGSGERGGSSGEVGAE